MYFLKNSLVIGHLILWLMQRTAFQNEKHQIAVRLSVTSCTLPMVALQAVWLKPWLKNNGQAGVALSHHSLSKTFKGPVM